jgi:ATP-dependent RNA circularization protein (DNA/RNA ligase family)
LQEEKIDAIQTKLEHAEQELAQFSKLPEIEEQLKQRMEALTQVRRPNQVRRGIHIIPSSKNLVLLFITSILSLSSLFLIIF